MPVLLLLRVLLLRRRLSWGEPLLMRARRGRFSRMESLALAAGSCLRCYGCNCTCCRRRSLPLLSWITALSALRSPLSALRSPLSALRSPLSALRSPAVPHAHAATAAAVSPSTRCCCYCRCGCAGASSDPPPATVAAVAHGNNTGSPSLPACMMLWLPLPQSPRRSSRLALQLLAQVVE